MVVMYLEVQAMHINTKYARKLIQKDKLCKHLKLQQNNETVDA